MNDRTHLPNQSQNRDSESEPEPAGPNLFLLYALLALGLLAASGFAWLVVLPFYHRH